MGLTQSIPDDILLKKALVDKIFYNEGKTYLIYSCKDTKWFFLMDKCKRKSFNVKGSFLLEINEKIFFMISDIIKQEPMPMSTHNKHVIIFAKILNILKIENLVTKKFNGYKWTKIDPIQDNLRNYPEICGGHIFLNNIEVRLPKRMFEYTIMDAGTRINSNIPVRINLSTIKECTKNDKR